MKKIVIDKSVLMSDERSLFCFNNVEVIIPLCVWELLNESDDRENEDVRRALLRLFHDLSKIRALKDGVNLNELTEESAFFKEDDIANCLVRLDISKSFSLSKVNRFDSRDYYSKVVQCAVSQKIQDEAVKLVTMDTALFTYAKNFIKTEIFTAQDIKDPYLYKGYRFIDVDSTFFDEFYSKKEIPDTYGLYPNEFAIFTDRDFPSKRMIGIGKIHQGNKVIKWCDLDNVRVKNMKTKPQNLEQRMFLYLLNDPDIKCISVTGVSGRGKTLLSTDFALASVFNKEYNNFLYTKSIIPADESEYMGYYKGTMDDKFLPHLQPLITCFEYIFEKEIKENKQLSINKDKNPNDRPMTAEKKYEDLKAQSVLSTIPLAEIRGMNIFNKIVILDEAQNVKKHVMKAFITRLTDSSKVIVSGDIEQIDNQTLTKYNNGLSNLISKGKDQEFIAHLTLDIDDKGSKRGKLATFGAAYL